MSRPEFWLEYTDTTWIKDDTTTTFVGTIYRDEALTLKKDLTGIVARAIISIDAPYFDKGSKEVTNHNQTINRGEFHLKFNVGVINEIGLFKIEVRLFEDGSAIGITHHEDFEVI